MRVLVTGVAGFIGAAVADALLARGDAVIGLDNLNPYYEVALKEARLARVAGNAPSGAFAFKRADFSDEAALADALEGEDFDRIVHLGAQAGVRYSLDNPMAYARSNLVGHLALLETARHRQLPHMVYASSSSVYGANRKTPFATEDRTDRPMSLYAATKKADELMSETYAHLYRLPLTGLRFFTVYGPWGRPDMALWRFAERIFAGEPIPVYNGGEMSRDFTYIDDIVAGVLACLDKPPEDNEQEKPGGSIAPHTIYNIGNNNPEQLMTMISALESAIGKKAQIDYLAMQPGDVPTTYADISAIARNVGYAPTTSIAEGIPAFVNWFREYRGL
ncbi:UDP-glucuronate 4-epimerase [Alteripontixanthobacter maritimus]|uniref:UDP-glucuronate 4-epimerase n=1 Tax=Alteripontixanthobacter maritimus TaxID=2161824 RepID=A0A369QFN2_9SPHN|nr:GDP-mannose 4,6-dehydratase [Alteripontixanthobacter maritimus]RDC61108.1 UDP-glucuronate 4-epimerase [Alteripontixanthobacter maritimus]